jgi:gamma-glutamylaminecyclotransferase
MWTKHNGVWFSKPNVLQHNVVAVYGTLKKGGSNHRLLYGQRFVGKGTTRDKYPLVISGLPYLLDKSAYGHHVEVEVYKVNNDTFAALDSLEGHPQFYQRKQIPIKLNSGTIVTAWIYFINKDTSYRSMGSMKYHKSFPIVKPIMRPKSSSFKHGHFWPKYTARPNYQQYTYEPNTRYHEHRDLFSSLSTIADKEDDSAKYCNICFEEVYYDETEISNQKYHCSVCNEMYSEQEVSS